MYCIKRRAAAKGIVANSLDRIGYRNGFQRSTSTKHLLADACNIIGDSYTLQTATFMERIRANTLDAIGNSYARQASTDRERRISNTLKPTVFTESNARQTTATAEHTITNGLHRIRYRNGFCRSTTTEHRIADRRNPATEVYSLNIFILGKSRICNGHIYIKGRVGTASYVSYHAVYHGESLGGLGGIDRFIGLVLRAVIGICRDQREFLIEGQV